MDIISINFAEKVPFRLKLPMIKAAIEVLFFIFISIFLLFSFPFFVCVFRVFMCALKTQRGVCFEITYSDLITDLQARRQMICNAKVRVLFPGLNFVWKPYIWSVIPEQGNLGG